MSSIPGTPKKALGKAEILREIAADCSPVIPLDSLPDDEAEEWLYQSPAKTKQASTRTSTSALEWLAPHDDDDDEAEEGGRTTRLDHSSQRYHDATVASNWPLQTAIHDREQQIQQQRLAQLQHQPLQRNLFADIDSAEMDFSAQHSPSTSIPTSKPRLSQVPSPRIVSSSSLTARPASRLPEPRTTVVRAPVRTFLPSSTTSNAQSELQPTVSVESANLSLAAAPSSEPMTSFAEPLPPSQINQNVTETRNQAVSVSHPTELPHDLNPTVHVDHHDAVDTDINVLSNNIQPVSQRIAENEQVAVVKEELSESLPLELRHELGAAETIDFQTPEIESDWVSARVEDDLVGEAGNINYEEPPETPKRNNQPASPRTPPSGRQLPVVPTSSPQMVVSSSTPARALPSPRRAPGSHSKRSERLKQSGSFAMFVAPTDSATSGEAVADEELTPIDAFLSPNPSLAAGGGWISSREVKSPPKRPSGIVPPGHRSTTK